MPDTPKNAFQNDCASARSKDSPAHSRESLANATSNPHKTTPAM